MISFVSELLALLYVSLVPNLGKNVLFEMLVIDEKSVLLGSKLLQHWFQVIRTKRIWIAKLDDIFQFLVRYEAVLVVINRTDCLHYFDHLVILLHGSDELIDVI